MLNYECTCVVRLAFIIGGPSLLKVLDPSLLFWSAPFTPKRLRRPDLRDFQFDWLVWLQTRHFQHQIWLRLAHESSIASVASPYGSKECSWLQTTRATRQIANSSVRKWAKPRTPVCICLVCRRVCQLHLKWVELVSYRIAMVDDATLPIRGKKESTDRAYEIFYR